MNLSKKIDLTLSQLTEWEDLISDNEKSFLGNLFKYPDSELLNVYFNGETVKCVFLVYAGATLTDSKPMNEFLKWANNL